VFETFLTPVKQLQESDHELLKQVSTQLNALPVMGSGGGGSRNPKMGEIPTFDGVGSKVRFEEWIDKVKLWHVHENVATDRQRIGIALGAMSGSAAIYARPWMKKVHSREDLGTWETFEKTIRAQYG
jgi:hypothetical protein